jgi:hypothetical protein
VFRLAYEVEGRLLHVNACAVQSWPIPYTPENDSRKKEAHTDERESFRDHALHPHTSQNDVQPQLFHIDRWMPLGMQATAVHQTVVLSDKTGVKHQVHSDRTGSIHVNPAFIADR